MWRRRRQAANVAATGFYFFAHLVQTRLQESSRGRRTYTLIFILALSSALSSSSEPGFSARWYPYESLVAAGRASGQHSSSAFSLYMQVICFFVFCFFSFNVSAIMYCYIGASVDGRLPFWCACFAHKVLSLSLSLSVLPRYARPSPRATESVRLNSDAVYRRTCIRSIYLPQCFDMVGRQEGHSTCKKISHHQFPKVLRA